jgi:hypothetical protein
MNAGAMERGVESEHRVLLLKAFDLAQLHLQRLLVGIHRVPSDACACGLPPLSRAFFRRSAFARLQHCAPLALLLAEMPPRIHVLALGPACRARPNAAQPGFDDLPTAPAGAFAGLRSGDSAPW